MSSPRRSSRRGSAPVTSPGRELIERLGRGLHARLTLLEAPAGSGKTTLLVEWHEAESSGVPFAWFSVDTSDNDPVRFWTSVTSSLRRAGLELPRTIDAALAAPATPAIEAGLPELIEALGASGSDVVLVLDDYHLIRDSQIHEGLALLLERGPPGLHVAIASRMAPPVGIARLRARGELSELPAEALRFDRPDVATLLNELLGLALTDGELDLLLDRTEGWAAGLYLAGLSLRARDDGAGLVASFSGEQRHLADYLLEEVLAGRPDELRQFLVRTAVLDRLSAPSVTWRTGASRIARAARRDRAHQPLPDSARRAPPLVPLPPPLPGPAPRRARARGSTHTEIRALHRRAAGWYAEHDEIARGRAAPLRRVGQRGRRRP